MKVDVIKTVMESEVNEKILKENVCKQGFETSENDDTSIFVWKNHPV